MIRSAVTSRAAGRRSSPARDRASPPNTLPELRPLPSWILAQGERRLAGRSVLAHGDDIWADDRDDDPDDLGVGEGSGPIAAPSAADRAAIAARAALAAGAALLGLDRIVRLDAPWLGALRMRQALLAATASARLLRHRGDARTLRDAHHLARGGDAAGDAAGATAPDPGPAGRLYRAWRELGRRPTRLAPETVCQLAVELGLPTAALDPRPALDGAGPVEAALLVSAEMARRLDPPGRPGGDAAAEVMAAMGADAALAEALGWPEPVPLLATALHDPALRIGPEGRRYRAGTPGWALTCHLGYARAAASAHAVALDLAGRSGRLEAAVRSLRTRGAETGLAALLKDDAVSARSLGLGSERAARRFLDRLAGQGALRELTGRPVFRLYGL